MSPPFYRISLVTLIAFLFTSQGIAKITIENSTFESETATGLIAPDIFTENAEYICIPISTRNFNNVAAIVAGISFNPSILSFDKINDRELTDVIAEFDESNNAVGIIWESKFSQPKGVTLADNEDLFELCFNVIGTESQKSQIKFVDLPRFYVQVISYDAQLLEHFVSDGSIEIGVQIIPTLGQWAVICLGLILVIIGVVGVSDIRSIQQLG